jgi:hypothetical protein
MIGSIQKYATAGVSILLAASIGYALLLKVEVANLNTKIEKGKADAALDLAKKLDNQTTEHSNQLIKEQQRVLDVQAKNRQLLTDIRRISDAKDRLAQSILVAYNRLRDSAADEFGSLPNDPGGHADDSTGSGEAPLNETLIEEMAKASEWCVSGWSRVRQIAAIQSACKK